MDSFDFYKHIYDRELNRRNKLDESINPIVGVISLLIGFISFFFTSEKYFKSIECNFILWLLFFVIIILMIISISYLVKSYNNFLRGFNYPNISYLKNIRDFQNITIPEYNEKVDENKKIDFENDLIDRIIRITDENTKINDLRADDLYFSKTYLIITLIALFITTLIIILKNTELC